MLAHMMLADFNDTSKLVGVLIFAVLTVASSVAGYFKKKREEEEKARSGASGGAPSPPVPPRPPRPPGAAAPPRPMQPQRSMHPPRPIQQAPQARPPAQAAPPWRPPQAPPIGAARDAALRQQREREMLAARRAAEQARRTEQAERQQRERELTDREEELERLHEEAAAHHSLAQRQMRATIRTQSMLDRIQPALKSRDGFAQAFVLSEIIGAPVGLRENHLEDR